jgi:hypothetical protein
MTTPWTIEHNRETANTSPLSAVWVVSPTMRIPALVDPGLSDDQVAWSVYCYTRLRPVELRDGQVVVLGRFDGALVWGEHGILWAPPVPPDGSGYVDSGPPE